MSCTWGACQKIRLARLPHRGVDCAAQLRLLWAAYEICSLMARAKISGKWLKFSTAGVKPSCSREKQQNRPSNPCKQRHAGMGGTDMSAIVQEQAILAGPVREVWFQNPSNNSWDENVFSVDLYTLNDHWNVICALGSKLCKQRAKQGCFTDKSVLIFKGLDSGNAQPFKYITGIHSKVLGILGGYGPKMYHRQSLSLAQFLISRHWKVK